MLFLEAQWSLHNMGGTGGKNQLSLIATVATATNVPGGCSESDHPSSLSPASMFVASLCIMRGIDLFSVHVSHESAVRSLRASEARDLSSIVGLIETDRR